MPGRRWAGAALLAAVVSLVGCSGGDEDEDEVSASALPKLVLQPADLPRGFFQFDSGKQTSGDAPPGERASPSRFGRQGGWKARYRRAQPSASGPFIVESRADLFESTDGAEEDLSALRKQLLADAQAAGPGARLHPDPEVGESAGAASTFQGTGTAAFR